MINNRGFILIFGLTLVGCSNTSLDLNSTGKGPAAYKNASIMPKAWVDSVSGQNASEVPPTTPPVEVATVQDQSWPQVPQPVSQPAPASLPYGTPVAGKTGLVSSPYSEKGYVDIRGFPPGSEVKDPYTGKVFLVPQ